MSLRRSLAFWIVPLAVVPATVAAQSRPEAVSESGAGELVALGLLVYGVYVAVSIAIGVVVLAVSEFVGSGSYVRALERRIYDRPLRSAALGVGTIVGGLVGIFLLTVVLLVLAELGAPDPVALLVAVPLFGGTLLLYVGATIGTIVLGSYLLRRLGDGDSNLWVALVVGSLVVNVPGLNLVLAFLVLFLGTGAVVDHWSNGRRDGPSGPQSRRPVKS